MTPVGANQRQERQRAPITAHTARRSRRRVRLVLAGLLAMMFLGSLQPGATPQVIAHNWGAAVNTPGPNSTLPPNWYLCTKYPDFHYWFSECSANGSSHSVQIDSSVPTMLRSSIQTAVTDVYDPILAFSMVVVTTATSSTDAKV